MKRVLVFAMAASLLVCSLGLCGCDIASNLAPSKAEPLTLTPKVSADALISEGTLVVGLDYSNPPYAGQSNSRVVGIDVDVACALADELGLKVKFVDIGLDGGPSALDNHTIDIFMDFEKDKAATIKATYAGTYLYDAPSLFAISTTGTTSAVDVAILGGTGATIAAQQGTTTADQVYKLYGSSMLIETATLPDAFNALETGQVTYAASSYIVGGYIISSYDDIVYASTLVAPREIGIGVATANTELATAVSTAVSTISTNGIADLVISKWIGTPLKPPVAASASGAAGAANTASTANTATSTAA